MLSEPALSGQVHFPHFNSQVLPYGALNLSQIICSHVSFVSFLCAKETKEEITKETKKKLKLIFLLLLFLKRKKSNKLPLRVHNLVLVIYTLHMYSRKIFLDKLFT
jgi:uncharacterized protein YsxB (DUF464 family)